MTFGFVIYLIGCAITLILLLLTHFALEKEKRIDEQMLMFMLESLMFCPLSWIGALYSYAVFIKLFNKDYEY